MSAPVFTNAVVDYQKANADPFAISRNSQVVHVLVIYTGGTIGMKAASQGYVPAADWLCGTLERLSRFNDVEFDAGNRQESVRLHDEDGSVRLAPHRVLITPTSLFNKRIRYSILEYDPLLDSAKYP